MKFSKSDIDALVDGMCPMVDYLVEIAGSSLFSGDVRRAMYKAAGLTAEGKPKPEKVRCWRIPGYYPDGRSLLTEDWVVPSKRPGAFPAAIPGTFVPDGAA